MKINYCAIALATLGVFPLYNRAQAFETKKYESSSGQSLSAKDFGFIVRYPSDWKELTSGGKGHVVGFSGKFAGITGILGVNLLENPLGESGCAPLIDRFVAEVSQGRIGDAIYDEHRKITFNGKPAIRLKMFAQTRDANGAQNTTGTEQIRVCHKENFVILSCLQTTAGQNQLMASRIGLGMIKQVCDKFFDSFQFVKP